MEAKKVNLFAFFMMIVMCMFSVYIGLANRAKNGIDGNDGLNGKDGTSVTLTQVYESYLTEKGLTKQDLTYTEFICDYYPDIISDEAERVSLVEATTQSALSSTVDICYPYYMTKPLIRLSQIGTVGNENAYEIVDDSSYAAAGICAGSGVIYSYEDTNTDGENDVAYIVTNYHVAYIAGYSNDDSYRAFACSDGSTSYMFTGVYDETKIKQVSGFVFQSVSYLLESDITPAPIETHFLDGETLSYKIYLYGYQTPEYAISATFVGGSADNDIAVLKVNKSDSTANELIFDSKYNQVAIGNSSDLNVGESVVAVGNPMLPNTSNITAGYYLEYLQQAEASYIDALCLSSTSGEVSIISEQAVFQSLLSNKEYMNLRLIRVSAAINSGNSGGGLYDTLTGRLVGLVNGKLESSSYDNVGFAIPVNIVVAIADQVIAQCQNKNDTRIKFINCDNLGITVSRGSSKSTKVNDIWKTSYNVKITESTLVNLFENDIIKEIKINDKTYVVYDVYDIDDILLNVKFGDTLKFVVSRYNVDVYETYDVTISLTQSMFKDLI